MPDLNKLKHYLTSNESKGNLNRFMRNKQRLVGYLLLTVLGIASIVLFWLASQNHKADATQANADTASHARVDGVLSTDFDQKNQLSALEQQQQQLDAIEKRIAALKKQGASSNAHNQQQREELLKQINKIIQSKQHKEMAHAGTNPQNRQYPQKATAGGSQYSSYGQATQQASDEQPNTMPFNSRGNGAGPIPVQSITFNYAKPVAYHPAPESFITVKLYRIMCQLAPSLKPYCSKGQTQMLPSTVSLIPCRFLCAC